VYVCRCSNTSKLWKCELDDTLPLRTISDWLQQIAAVFVTSQFIHDIYVHVTRSVADTHDSKTEAECTTGQLMSSSDGNRCTDVFPVTVTDSERHSLNCCKQRLPADMPPTSASLPPYLNDRVTDNDTASAPTSAETVGSCEGRYHQMSSQPVDSGRRSHDGSDDGSAAAIVNSRAGQCHCQHSTITVLILLLTHSLTDLEPTVCVCVCVCVCSWSSCWC